MASLTEEVIGIKIRTTLPHGVKGFVPSNPFMRGGGCDPFREFYAMAAKRNYQPTLLKLANILNKFITRYRALIDAGLTPEQAVYVSALATALDNLITAVPPGTGT